MYLQVKWAGQQKIIQWSKRGYIAHEPIVSRGLQQKLLMGALSKATGSGGGLQQKLLMGAMAKAAGSSPKVKFALGVLKAAGYSKDVAVKALGCLKSGKSLINCGISLPGKLFKHFVRISATNY